MAGVLDVAAYILWKQGPMTAMKLQKLVYYSQAWSLVRRGISLFDDEIQAWAYGPVVYELFQQHRGEFVVGSVRGDPARLSGDERRHIDGVLKSYGHLDGAELSKMTHREDPWRLAREDVPKGQPSMRVITHEAMRRFYSGVQMPLAACR